MGQRRRRGFIQSNKPNLDEGRLLQKWSSASESSGKRISSVKTGTFQDRGM